MTIRIWMVETSANETKHVVLFVFKEQRWPVSDAVGFGSRILIRPLTNDFSFTKCSTCFQDAVYFLLPSSCFFSSSDVCSWHNPHRISQDLRANSCLHQILSMWNRLRSAGGEIKVTVCTKIILYVGLLFIVWASWWENDERGCCLDCKTIV